MREYHIYKIREDVALDYYGMETKLFQLFQENREAKGRLKEATEKQIQYIIQQVNKVEIQDHLNKYLRETEGYIMRDNKHYIMSPKRNSQAGLCIYKMHIKLFSEGSQDSEACFFEALRNYDGTFIAMDFSREQYGWLKPLKSLEIAELSESNKAFK
ncbi:sporulation inhibitor of replication protein SirA [Evansella sp. LMS18]|jgi:hypothetical protein|uniref:sporulation inhibitor of replication protein SirA n=1 Tax=Evansella sp. LMS18 TaxID=2924033 RepID=UPI0020D1EE38|nr:sporulation inhibitor of replication protein SirA [Evansella sp. LMS18]UTR10773.1 sporulation inhibitor of replication protein SirA [Evansella sp. LMS18]